MPVERRGGVPHVYNFLYLVCFHTGKSFPESNIDKYIQFVKPVFLKNLFFYIFRYPVSEPFPFLKGLSCKALTPSSLAVSKDKEQEDSAHSNSAAGEIT